VRAKEIGVGKLAVAFIGLKLAVAFIGLNTLDAYLTHKVVVEGSGYELNPLVRSVLETSPSHFWLWKVLGSAVLAGLLLLVARRFPRTAKNVLILCVGILLLICIWNIISMGVSSV